MINRGLQRVECPWEFTWRIMGICEDTIASKSEWIYCRQCCLARHSNASPVA
jgi:hypothetical protein